jgi:hypothetical protein
MYLGLRQLCDESGSEGTGLDLILVEREASVDVGFDLDLAHQQDRVGYPHRERLISSQADNGLGWE